MITDDIASKCLQQRELPQDVKISCNEGNHTNSVDHENTAEKSTEDHKTLQRARVSKSLNGKDRGVGHRNGKRRNDSTDCEESRCE